MATRSEIFSAFAGVKSATMPAPSTASEVGELRAKVAEWERLRDPAVLHASLLKGLPAKLKPRELLHIAGYSQHEVDAALAAKTANPSIGEVNVEAERDASRWRRWAPYLSRTLKKLPFDLAKDLAATQSKE